MSTYNPEYYRRNREKLIARTRRYGKKNKYYQKTRNPLKFKARYTARAAEKGGRLAKIFCQRCSAKQNLEFHHPDYNKPLDVLILCKGCHFALHRELKGGVK